MEITVVSTFYENEGRKIEKERKKQEKKILRIIAGIASGILNMDYIKEV